MTQQSAKKAFTGQDVIVLLMKKLKLIICVTLIFTVIAGGAAAAVSFNNVSYGNSVSFYLSKTDKSEKFLPLLTADTFAELLLLDEYGLPAEFANDPQYKDEYNEAKAAVIAFNAAREQFREISKIQSRISISLTTPKDPETGAVISSMSEIETRYSDLDEAYTKLYNLIAIYKSASTDQIVTEEHKHQVQILEAELEEARLARDAYKASAYDPAVFEKIQIQNRYTEYSNAVKDTRKAAEEAVTPLLDKWRALDDVQEKVSVISSALSFTYEIPGEEGSIIEKEEPANTTLPETDENKDAYLKAFLKVFVSVEGDEEFANFIIKRVKEVIPGFAEINIEQFDGTATVDCTITSPSSRAEALNLTDAIAQTALITIVAFVVALVVICLAIVAKEWKRRIMELQ